MSDPVLGELRAFAIPYEIEGWMQCNGQVLSVDENPALFSLLGATFGGDGARTFALPDIRGRMLLGEGRFVDKLYPPGEKGGAENNLLTQNNLPAHTHALQCNTAAGKTGSPAGAILAGIQGGSQAYITVEQAGKTHDFMDSDSVSTTGEGKTLENMPPFLVMTYRIATLGIYPAGSGDAEDFIGEIKAFAFTRRDGYLENWLPCDGRQLQCRDNQALFSLLGNRFGGDGRTTFNLPDLRGRIPLYSRTRRLGESGGTATNTLTLPQLPAHSHVLNSDQEMGSQATPRTNFWASTTSQYYSLDAPNAVLDPSVITSTGESEPFGNLPPYLAANFCICVRGLYPARS